MTKNNSTEYSDNTLLKNISILRIIAVGASAGGLEALKAFLGNIDEDDKNSYIVIQHLSPDYMGRCRLYDQMYI